MDAIKKDTLSKMCLKFRVFLLVTLSGVLFLLCEHFGVVWCGSGFGVDGI